MDNHPSHMFQPLWKVFGDFYQDYTDYPDVPAFL